MELTITSLDYLCPRAFLLVTMTSLLLYLVLISRLSISTFSYGLIHYICGVIMQIRSPFSRGSQIFRIVMSIHSEMSSALCRNSCLPPNRSGNICTAISWPHSQQVLLRSESDFPSNITVTGSLSLQATAVRPPRTHRNCWTIF